MSNSSLTQPLSRRGRGPPHFTYSFLIFVMVPWSKLLLQ
jgi:hypothetical protein